MLSFHQRVSLPICLLKGSYQLTNTCALTEPFPLFNSFLEKLLRQLSIAPSQLHPNGYAILMGLCVLSMGVLKRLPTFEEINFLCTFANGKTHPSIINVKGARNRRLILELPESAHGYLNQFFYVNCPAGFYSIWREGGEITHIHSTFFEFP